MTRKIIKFNQLHKKKLLGKYLSFRSLHKERESGGKWPWRMRIYIGKNKESGKLGNSTKQSRICKVHCKWKGKQKQASESTWKTESYKLLWSQAWKNLKMMILSLRIRSHWWVLNWGHGKSHVWGRIIQ